MYASCTDGFLDGDELEVDCGGSCPPCPSPPSCFDGIQNGLETGIDCGGSCAACECNACTLIGAGSTINPAFNVPFAVSLTAPVLLNGRPKWVYGGGSFSVYWSGGFWYIDKDLSVSDGVYAYSISNAPCPGNISTGSWYIYDGISSFLPDPTFSFLTNCISAASTGCPAPPVIYLLVISIL